ncbi:MAG TPA: membrane protein insertion efficiency factor YidD [Burkholderiaceae bacterium]
MLEVAGAALIRVYQRHLSPRKGYRCAYGVLHGAGTCSSIGLAIMEQQGFWAFWRQMPLQFDACKAAALSLREEREKRELETPQGRLVKRCCGTPNTDAECEFMRRDYDVVACRTLLRSTQHANGGDCCSLF